MKQFEVKLYLSAFLLSVTLTMALPVSAQVYKSVDENGTVIYSDTPPAKDAKPVKLPPISIVEAPDYPKAANVAADKAEEESGFSLRSLRRSYKDFAIVAPKQDESIFHPQGPVTAAWSTHYQLQPGMQVTMILDGKEQAPTTAQIIPLGKLDRGEHRVQAVLTDAKQRNIASTATVTFYIHRPNIYTNPNRSPGRSNGGG